MEKVLEPLSDKILVRQTEAADRTLGGIYIPDKAKEKPKEAIVISVGPGRRLENGELIPIHINPGDRVLFSSYAGQPVEVNGEELLLMGQDDVLARIVEDQ